MSKSRDPQSYTPTLVKRNKYLHLGKNLFPRFMAANEKKKKKKVHKALNEICLAEEGGGRGVQSGRRAKRTNTTTKNPNKFFS